MRSSPSDRQKAQVRAAVGSQFESWAILLSFAGIVTGIGKAKPYSADVRKGFFRPGLRAPEAADKADIGAHIVAPWLISVSFDSILHPVVKVLKAPLSDAAPVFMGDWNQAANYAVGEVVESQNYFFLAKAVNTDVRPGNPATWLLLEHFEPLGEDSAASNLARGIITAKLIS